MPPEFGGSWENFCADWCPEGLLAYSADEVCLGLATLARLWPAKVASIAAKKSGKGILQVVGPVETGLVLARCESVPHFSRVLERMKSGQRAPDLNSFWLAIKLASATPRDLRTHEADHRTPNAKWAVCPSLLKCIRQKSRPPRSSKTGSLDSLKRRFQQLCPIVGWKSPYSCHSRASWSLELGYGKPKVCPRSPFQRFDDLNFVGM
jgi:hypothetical protein